MTRFCRNSSQDLLSSTVLNGRLLRELDLAATTARSLDGLDDGHALRIGVINFTEDDVLAIEPAGDDGGDEELRAVGVGASVSHGQQTRLDVLVLEVLILELLTVDRLATGTVATSEVTTLKHELWDDTVEGGALVALALLVVITELSEVLDCLGGDVVVELELDAAGLYRSLAGRLVLSIKDGTLPGHVEPCRREFGHVCGCCVGVS